MKKAMKCGENQIYDIRAECPKTCMDPNGNNSCGMVNKVDGCFCKNGYVEYEKNKCIKKEECGCNIPNEDTIIDVKNSVKIYFLVKILFK